MGDAATAWLLPVGIGGAVVRKTMGRRLGNRAGGLSS